MSVRIATSFVKLFVKKGYARGVNIFSLGLGAVPNPFQREAVSSGQRVGLVGCVSVSGQWDGRYLRRLHRHPERRKIDLRAVAVMLSTFPNGKKDKPKRGVRSRATMYDCPRLYPFRR